MECFGREFNMQLDMQYIYEIYRSGSFSKAAEKLYITQPALSIAVAKVEASIGMPLFDRSTRPVTLTQAGRIYIDAVEKARNLEQDLEQQFADIRDLKKGKIVIGATHYINSYILAPILKEFDERYPGIEIELVESSSSEIVELLKKREIDVTLNCDPNIIVQFGGYPVFSDIVLLAVPQEDPINTRLQKFRLTAEDVMRGRHLETDCPCVSLKEFENEEFILLKEGNNLYERSLKLFHEAGIEPRVKLKISQLVTAFHLVDQGFAAAFISDRLIQHKNLHLCCYKLDDPTIFRRFYILLNNQRYVSNSVRAFIHYMQDAYANVSYPADAR